MTNWASLEKSGGLSEDQIKTLVGPLVTVKEVNDEVVLPVLDLVLSVLGIAKLYAGLFEDPLGAVAKALEEQLLSYLKDEGGFAFAWDGGRIASSFGRNLSTGWGVPARFDTGSASSWDAVNNQTKNLLACIEPFRGIESFKEEYARRLLDKSYTNRPVAYNSTVVGIFVSASVGSDAIPSFMKLLTLIRRILGTGVNFQPVLNGFDFKYGFNRTGPDLIVDYEDACQQDKDPDYIQFRVNLELLTSLTEEAYIVLYTNEAGFQVYVNDGYGNPIPFYLTPYLETLDKELLIKDGKIKQVDLGAVKDVSRDGLYPDEVINIQEYQAYIPVSSFLMAVRAIEAPYEDIFKLKIPVLDTAAEKITATTPAEKVYARIYFAESGIYSQPIEIPKIKKVPDYVKVFDTVICLLCLLESRFEALGKTPAAGELTAEKARIDRVRSLIPSDLLYFVDLYRERAKGRTDTDEGFYNYFGTYTNFMKSYRNFNKIFKISDYDSYKDSFLKLNSAYASTSDQFISSRMSFKSDITFNEDVKTFLEGVLINKTPITPIATNPDDPWIPFWAYDLTLLKVVYTDIVLGIKTLADKLRGAGSGLVRVIESLEKIIEGLRKLSQAISTIIQTIISFIEGLSRFSGSINILFLTADSTQDLANQLRASSMPDNPNSSSDYFFGCSLVWKTGLPSFLNGLFLGVLNSQGLDVMSAATSEGISVETEVGI